MKPYGIIYQVTNLVNGKKYIGQTTKTLVERWRGHLSLHRYGNGFLLHKAIRKYGIENFVVESLCECLCKRELDESEKNYIVRNNTIVDNKHGYNLTYGGGGSGVPSKVTRKKMSVSLTGHAVSEEARKRMSVAGKGRNKTEDHKNKIRLSNIGKNMGKKASDETREKMSKSRKGEKSFWYGKHLSDEHRKKLSERSKLNTQGVMNANAKLWRITKDGHTCEVKSLATWCKEHGIVYGTIHDAMEKVRPHKGYLVERG